MANPIYLNSPHRWFTGRGNERVGNLYRVEFFAHDEQREDRIVIAVGMDENHGKAHSKALKRVSEDFGIHIASQIKRVFPEEIEIREVSGIKDMGGKVWMAYHGDNKVGRILQSGSIFIADRWLDGVGPMECICHVDDFEIAKSALITHLQNRVEGYVEG